MRKFIYSMQSYPIYISGGFQNMAQSIPKNFPLIKFGYISLDRLWCERPRIKVHSIGFFRNYFGILLVVKVMLDTYVIVLAIHSLLNRYSSPIVVSDRSHEWYMIVLSSNLWLRFRSIRRVNLWTRMWRWMIQMRMMDLMREWTK